MAYNPDTFRAAPPAGAAPTTTQLQGGKAIAAYVGRDERTIRRWAKKYGFPAYRLHGRLVADTRRIDLWRETSTVHASAIPAVSRAA